MNKTRKITFLLIFFSFIGLILATVFWFTSFKYGCVLQTGDLRLHINQALIGDQFLNLVSNRFSNNNFIYLSFYSLFSLLGFLPYRLILVYIFFFIPALLFASLLCLLMKVVRFDLQKGSVVAFTFLCCLAFYFAINPAFFNRLGHFTILHSIIFLPLLIYALYRFLAAKKIVNHFLFLFFLFLYLAGSTPHIIVVSNLIIAIVYTLVLLIYKPNFWVYIKKGALIGLVVLFSQLHIIYPFCIGQGTAKSLKESETTTHIFESLSKYSNIYTAINGTNYYHDELVRFPSPVSTGLLIFVLTIIFLLVYKRKNLVNNALWFGALISLIIVSGYRVFPFFYDILNHTLFKSFTWLIKDPNIYYLVFLIPLLCLFARLVIFNLKNHGVLFILSIIILLTNLLFILFSDKRNFNQFYDFIKIPDSYFHLQQELASLGNRNFWIPYNVYVRKNFSKEITYFPNPALWLTKNKELTKETEVYRKLIETVEKEIFDSGCQNIYFLDFIIAAQDLNVVIDQNSINNPTLDIYDTEEKIVQAGRCMSKIPHLEKILSLENINVYRSKLEIKNEVYYYQGSIDSLNNFVKENPVHIIFESALTEKAEKLDIKDFSILNESFDMNWQDATGKFPLYQVDFASMLFEDSSGNFTYQGSQDFEIIVRTQKLAVLLIIISCFVIELSRWLKKIFLTIRL